MSSQRPLAEQFSPVRRPLTEWHRRNSVRQAIPRTKNAQGVFLACLVVGASGLYFVTAVRGFPRFSSAAA